MTLDILKKLFTFSWAQAFSDQNGKSSIVPVAAFIVILTGCIGFLKGVFMKESDALVQSVVIIGIGAGLLGYHKAVDGPPKDMGITDGTTSVPLKSSSTTIATVTQETSVTPDQP